MQINQLRYFVHVAELGSFSRAATHMHVAQSAVSRQVRLLEQELGVQLLHRHGRGIRLTGPGSELLNRAAGLLQQLRAVREAVMASGSIIEGEVRLGLPTWAAELLLPGVLLRARQAHPLLAIRVFESSSVSILEEWLLSGRVDLAVVGEISLLSRNLTTWPLIRQSITLVGRADMPQPTPHALPFRKLAGLPLVISAPGYGVREPIDLAARKSGVQLSPAIEVDSFAVARELVRRDGLYALLPRDVVRGAVDAGLFWSQEITQPRIERALLLASSVERPLTGSGRVVRDMLLREAELSRSEPGAGATSGRGLQ